MPSLDLPVVTDSGALPGGAFVVADPGSWSAQDVHDLEQHVKGGGTAVVVTPPADDLWADLLGVDLPTSGDRPTGELVLEPTAHPAARNLPVESVVVAPLTPFVPREGTATVVQTRLRLARQAAVTVREVGDGTVVGVAIPLEADREGTATTAIRRLVAGTSGTAGEIGLGVIGYGQHGGMGWLHGRAASRTDGLRLAAVAELDEGRLADAGAHFPGAGLHREPADLLADDQVDLVVVATPPSTHHQIAMDALRAGKHVVVEKPLCFTAAQADELLAAADNAGRTLTVHQNRRWDADFRAIRRVIDEGRLGEVFNVETFVGGFEHPCLLWHSDRGVSGGRLYDWGAHLIDQTLRILDAGTPTEVRATGHKVVWHDVTNLDQVRVRMSFEHGKEAEFLDSDVLAVRRPKYVVQGTRGTLVGHYRPVVHEAVTDDDGYVRTEHHHAEGPAHLVLAEHHPGWGLQEVAVPPLPAPRDPFHAALVDHLQLGDPVPVDPVEVRDVTAVLEAANTSAHDGGRPVRPA